LGPESQRRAHEAIRGGEECDRASELFLRSRRLAAQMLD
jgi:hypothetical protein